MEKQTGETMHTGYWSKLELGLIDGAPFSVESTYLKEKKDMESLVFLSEFHGSSCYVGYVNDELPVDIQVRVVF